MKKALFIILSIINLGTLKANETKQLEIQAEMNISGFGNLSYTTNKAITSIIELSAHELRKQEKHELAKKLETEWRKLDGYLIDVVVNNRDIGWFKPLIEWLAVTYELIELELGLELCRALRISDLKTINHGIIVVFRPCYYGLKEFTLHFVHDDKYRGFAPVISYWAAALSCTAALHGAGYFFVCSPTAMLIERVVDKRIAPKVAPKIYNAACTI